jgi:hypothetical protein
VAGAPGLTGHVVSAVRRHERRQFQRLTAPFDLPFYRDPLFRWGWVLSTLGCLVLAAGAVAKGDLQGVAGVFQALVIVLGAPLVLTWSIFGVVGGSIRGFRRGWKGP